jgi:hypothetical protein
VPTALSREATEESPPGFVFGGAASRRAYAEQSTTMAELAAARVAEGEDPMAGSEAADAVMAGRKSRGQRRTEATLEPGEREAEAAWWEGQAAEADAVAGALGKGKRAGERRKLSEVGVTRDGRRGAATVAGLRGLPDAILGRRKG